MVSPAVLDEDNKIRIKISKIVSYWDHTSLLIPNVFRLARALDDDPLHLLEHQDLSKKELLVQSNGQKAKYTSSEAEDFESMMEEIKEIKHKSSDTMGNKKLSSKKKVKEIQESFQF